MKVALASAPVKTLDLEYNLKAMCKEAESYKGKTDLIVFGESVLQGFESLSWNYEEDKNVAVDMSSHLITHMQEVAKDSGMAISFGFIEKEGENLYSSQVFIGKQGEIVNNYHRVSVGWKEVTKTDTHYKEGSYFEKFEYEGRSFAIGLCGDLWTEGRPEEMKKLNADIILWPIWCDYDAREWNEKIKYEYAEQAGKCGKCVLLVNPFCVDKKEEVVAAGGAALFENSKIVKEIESGKIGTLLVEI